MSSDNRAAHFLARTYPTGKAQFIKEMNIKAALLGMKDSVFYDSIGLNNDRSLSRAFLQNWCFDSNQLNAKQKIQSFLKMTH